MPLPSLDPPIPAGTATALGGSAAGTVLRAPAHFFSWVRACEVDKKHKESPSGDEEEHSRGVSNPVAIVLALGILGVLGLLTLVVMSLIFVFQKAL
jgi:hypothetical protein